MFRDKDMKNYNENRSPEVLTEGIWEDGTPWKFIQTAEAPPLHLSTAVFCVTTYNGKIILAENGKRGWELPGGHIEPGESLDEAVRREVHEETGAVIEKIEQFGFKMVSPNAPIPHRDNPENFYPYPHSYVPYFFAEATEVSDIPLADDVIGVKLASLDEAKQLLAKGHNHDVLIEYLQQTSKINLL